MCFIILVSNLFCCCHAPEKLNTSDQRHVNTASKQMPSSPAKSPELSPSKPRLAFPCLRLRLVPRARVQCCLILESLVGCHLVQGRVAHWLSKPQWGFAPSETAGKEKSRASAVGQEGKSSCVFSHVRLRTPMVYSLRCDAALMGQGKGKHSVNCLEIEVLSALFPGFL